MSVLLARGQLFSQHKSVRKSFMLLSSYHYSQWGGGDGVSLKISIGKKLVAQTLYKTPVRAHSYFINGGETFH